MSPAKTTSREESAMKSKLLTAVIAAAFITVSGASWAYVAPGQHDPEIRERRRLEE